MFQGRTISTYVVCIHTNCNHGANRKLGTPLPIRSTVTVTQSFNNQRSNSSLSLRKFKTLFLPSKKEAP